MYESGELLNVLGSDSDEGRLEVRLTWRFETNMSQPVTALEVSNKSKTRRGKRLSRASSPFEPAHRDSSPSERNHGVPRVIAFLHFS